ncbi:MAG: hypothetical protein QY326_01375 [Bdellovibrionota bacterium]|nr:MAG: hypothetical protein QY326_01375 [Bdellovibrionota bacterium]
MHSAVAIDGEAIVREGPLERSAVLSRVFSLLILLGAAGFALGFATRPAGEVWSVYWVNVFFWTGLACGGVVTSAIFQIVRAKWSAPIRRLGESFVSFLPFAYIFFLFSILGREHLFPWARTPMPGREWWMQPDFVYARFAILLAILFWFMSRFVSLSLRGDVALAQQKAPSDGRWQAWWCNRLTRNFHGSKEEILETQRSLSVRAPLLILFYAVIYSLFAFEMLMATDVMWFSNMYGGFIFLGNIYVAWGGILLVTIYATRRHRSFGGAVSQDQLWDTGKLMFAFCMLWGYTFFAQFLPQWYGNLPEETQWLILRTRELPWKQLGWVTFAMAFIIPFIVLLSRDVKRTPKVLIPIIAVIWCGVWLDKYMVVMPQVSPAAIPFGMLEILSFLGFLGAFGLCVLGFLTRYPLAIVSSPLAKGSVEW